MLKNKSRKLKKDQEKKSKASLKKVKKVAKVFNKEGKQVYPLKKDNSALNYLEGTKYPGVISAEGNPLKKGNPILIGSRIPTKNKIKDNLPINDDAKLEDGFDVDEHIRDFDNELKMWKEEIKKGNPVPFISEEDFKKKHKI